MPDPRSTSHGGEGPRTSYEQMRSDESRQASYLKLFPQLNPLIIPTSVLLSIGGRRLDQNNQPTEEVSGKDGPMVDPDEGQTWDGQAQSNDNEDIPAGYTYLGQFIDHDLTLDFTSDPTRRNRVSELPNARTPAFDLDSFYGLGPEVHPHLYEEDDKLVVERRGKDLQRRAGSSKEPSKAIAIIGDPRNDENQLVAQIHLALVNLHNKFVDRFGGDFETARRLTRWHYQWVVLHDFLPRIVGQDLVDDVRFAGPVFFTGNKRNAIPIEFSVAAYRFGHSQVKPNYVIKSGANPVPVFADDNTGNDLRGSTKLTDERKVEWGRFFDIDGSNPQPTRTINTQLSSALFRMFPGPPDEDSDVLPEERRLAFRNLRRGVAMGLPSGEEVAKYMKQTLDQRGRPHDKIVLDLGSNLGELYRQIRVEGETPLWYWILAEAATHYQGKQLGPIGGRIVAEVFIGLLENDERSFLRVEPGWKPEEVRRGQRFDMVTLLHAAGEVPA